MRLKDAATQQALAQAGFQFHKGAIKSSSFLFFLLVFQMFQFHKGAIKSQGSTSTNFDINLFQFHKGAIKSRLCYCRF